VSAQLAPQLIDIATTSMMAAPAKSKWSAHAEPANHQSRQQLPLQGGHRVGQPSLHVNCVIDSRWDVTHRPPNAMWLVGVTPFGAGMNGDRYGVKVSD
jgi:hypothetical protein